ncbi:MAG TPA: hypothetical protein VLI69_07420 [Gammaproteobacteria bacterium]|nr:hypothetical protein [Gammaproteobacteria bacterium]
MLSGTGTPLLNETESQNTPDFKTIAPDFHGTFESLIEAEPERLQRKRCHRIMAAFCLATASVTTGGFYFIRWGLNDAHEKNIELDSTLATSNEIVHKFKMNGTCPEIFEYDENGTCTIKQNVPYCQGSLKSCDVYDPYIINCGNLDYLSEAIDLRINNPVPCTTPLGQRWDNCFAAPPRWNFSDTCNRAFGLYESIIKLEVYPVLSSALVLALVITMCSLAGKTNYKRSKDAILDRKFSSLPSILDQTTDPESYKKFMEHLKIEDTMTVREALGKINTFLRIHCGTGTAVKLSTSSHTFLASPKNSSPPQTLVEIDTTPKKRMSVNN